MGGDRTWLGKKFGVLVDVFAVLCFSKVGIDVSMMLHHWSSSAAESDLRKVVIKDDFGPLVNFFTKFLLVCADRNVSMTFVLETEKIVGKCTRPPLSDSVARRLELERAGKATARGALDKRQLTPEELRQAFRRTKPLQDAIIEVLEFHNANHITAPQEADEQLVYMVVLGIIQWALAGDNDLLFQGCPRYIQVNSGVFACKPEGIMLQLYDPSARGIDSKIRGPLRQHGKGIVQAVMSHTGCDFVNFPNVGPSTAVPALLAAMEETGEGPLHKDTISVLRTRLMCKVEFKVDQGGGGVRKVKRGDSDFQRLWDDLVKDSDRALSKFIGAIVVDPKSFQLCRLDGGPLTPGDDALIGTLLGRHPNDGVIGRKMAMGILQWTTAARSGVHEDIAPTVEEQQLPLVDVALQRAQLSALPPDVVRRLVPEAFDVTVQNVDTVSEGELRGYLQFRSMTGMSTLSLDKLRLIVKKQILRECDPAYPLGDIVTNLSDSALVRAAQQLGQLQHKIFSANIAEENWITERVELSHRAPFLPLRVIKETFDSKALRRAQTDLNSDLSERTLHINLGDSNCDTDVYARGTVPASYTNGKAYTVTVSFELSDRKINGVPVIAGVRSSVCTCVAGAAFGRCWHCCSLCLLLNRLDRPDLHEMLSPTSLECSWSPGCGNGITHDPNQLLATLPMRPLHVRKAERTRAPHRRRHMLSYVPQPRELTEREEHDLSQRLCERLSAVFDNLRRPRPRLTLSTATPHAYTLFDQPVGQPHPLQEDEEQEEEEEEEEVGTHDGAMDTGP